MEEGLSEGRSSAVGERAMTRVTITRSNSKRVALGVRERTGLGWLHTPGLCTQVN